MPTQGLFITDTLSLLQAESARALSASMIHFFMLLS
jgi:hypothetical protein